MPQPPNLQILDRKSYEEIITKHYSPIIALLDEVANYGSTLCANSFDQSEKKLSDAVILAVMLKHSVTMLDALSIQLAKCAVTASQVSLRALFENALYIRWVLKKNTAFRTAAFYYWDIKNQLSWARSAKTGTDENQRLEADLADMKGHTRILVDQQELERTIDILQKKLRSPELLEVHTRFQEMCKSRTRRPKDWYALDGAENLREVAKSVEWLGQYKVFYAHFSRATHGAAVDRHISIRGKELLFEPVRNPADWDQIVRLSLSVSFSTYRSIIAHFCPNEEGEFRKLYITEWRSRFNSIGSVKASNGSFEFTFAKNDAT